MKTKVYLLCAMAVCVFTACGKSDSAEKIVSEADTAQIVNETDTAQAASEDVSEQAEEKVVYSTEADLTHDNQQCTVQIETCSSEGRKISYVRIYDSDSDLVWESGRMSSIHAENNMFFLIHRDEGDYILQYLPDYATGCCTYGFTLFHLNEENEIVTDDEDLVEFVAEPSTTWDEEEMYPAEQMESFADHLNQYLEDGYLLIDACDHEQLYSTSDDRVFFEEHYQRLFKITGLTATDDTAENIALYKEYLLSEQKKLGEREAEEQ